jgi:hypothetical protein
MVKLAVANVILILAMLARVSVSLPIAFVLLVLDLVSSLIWHQIRANAWKASDLGQYQLSVRYIVTLLINPWLTGVSRLSKGNQMELGDAGRVSGFYFFSGWPQRALLTAWKGKGKETQKIHHRKLGGTRFPAG